LDFELCYINGKVAVCANDTYNDDTNQNATNTILFSDAIKSIKTKAFTMNDLKQPANWNEPLFIHLRLKFTTLTDTAAKKGFYDAISAALSDISVYTNISLTNVTNIKLNEVTSGIYHPCFIMLDITNVDTTASSYVGSDFSKLINTTTGFTNKAVNQLYFYDDLAPVESGGLLDANKQKIPTLTKFSYNNFRIVVPKGQYLPSTYYPYDFVKNYGAQVLTQSAFLSDYGMSKYSQIFTGSYGSMTAYVSIDSVNRLSMQDVRYDMMRDIKLGIYISICLVLGVGFISSMYT
jgi:hypothetical protein